MSNERKANITWLTDLLATGGDLSFDERMAEEQVAEIVEDEVELIIDMREEANDKALWEEEGLYYLWLPTDDAEGHHIPRELFDDAVFAAMPHLTQNRKVLVHCHMGVNRGPSVAFAVLLEQGYGAVQAYDLIREKRPSAAIMYAEDALKAHIRRHGPTHGDGTYTRQQCVQMSDALKARIREVWTPEERARVKRIIREHREQDRYERDR